MLYFAENLSPQVSRTTLSSVLDLDVCKNQIMIVQCMKSIYSFVNIYLIYTDIELKTF